MEEANRNIFNSRKIYSQNDLDQALFAQKQAFKKMVESHKLDDRPEITEWLVKTKAETKAYNSALDDVLAEVEKL
jgi:hypothetical protein